MAKNKKTTVAAEPTYDDFYADSFKLGEKSANQQIAANNAATDKYVADTKGIYAETAAQLTKDAQQSKEQLNQQYQRNYDMNAAAQLVAERQLKEKMANLGMTDSGFNRTQQTALAINKMNADRAVTQQKTAAGDSIQRTLDDNLAANSSELQSKIIAAIKENEEKNAALKTALHQATSEAATSMYNNYLTNKTNSAIAAQESADARYKIDTEAAAKLGVASINASKKSGSSSGDKESSLDKAIRETAATIYKAKIDSGDTGYTYGQAMAEATSALTGETEKEAIDKNVYSDFTSSDWKLFIAKFRQGSNAVLAKEKVKQLAESGYIKDKKLISTLEAIAGGANLPLT